MDEVDEERSESPKKRVGGKSKTMAGGIAEERGKEPIKMLIGDNTEERISMPNKVWKMKNGLDGTIEERGVIPKKKEEKRTVLDDIIVENVSEDEVGEVDYKADKKNEGHPSRKDMIGKSMIKKRVVSKNIEDEEEMDESFPKETKLMKERGKYMMK